MKKKVAVIGAGNGGQAIAGHMGLSGYQVWLYDVDRAKISALQEKGEIHLQGDEHGWTSNIQATVHMEEAVKDAGFIMVTTPATSHDEVAAEIAPFLEDDQILILNPGYFLGALAFSRALGKKGCRKDITLGETECLIYACRSEEPGNVYISGVKKRLLIAAFPSNKTGFLMEKIKNVYPQYQAARNILETTFGNVNFILHAPIALLNAGSIDSKREFLFYREGGTPSIMKLEERLDQERLAVADRFGVKARSITELLTDYYGVTGNTLYDIVKKNPAYQPIKAPQNLHTRLISEDIPMGLVPMASAAEKFGVNAPLHRTLVDLASALLDVNYWSLGRTMESLGLAELDEKQISHLLNEG